MQKLKELPDIDKPREKLIRKGVSSLSDVELLAVLLGKGKRGKDVLEIAKEIKNTFEDNLDKAKMVELLKIDGVGNTKACQILASFELARRYNGKKLSRINCLADVLPFVRDIINKNQEHFKCLTLNGANEVIENRVITVGLLNSNQIHPREIFSEAIADRAASIILVHNHPSGDLEPSEEDINITNQMIKAGKILGIKVLDHIIVSKKGYSSILESVKN